LPFLRIIFADHIGDLAGDKHSYAVCHRGRK
jgi:hypothetical protein